MPPPRLLWLLVRQLLLLVFSAGIDCWKAHAFLRKFCCASLSLYISRERGREISCSQHMRRKVKKQQQQQQKFLFLFALLFFFSFVFSHKKDGNVDTIVYDFLDASFVILICFYASVEKLACSPSCVSL